MASGSRTPRWSPRPSLSHRYITDRFLPDKAIDLVDEASAVVRTEIDSMPQELDAITRRVMQLEIEEAALEKESDPASGTRLEALRKELADLRAQADAMTAQWEAERQAIRRLQALREEIEQLRREIEDAERRYDLNRAAELRHGRLPELERQLQAEEERLAQKQGETRLLREEVTEDEIAEIVARWTGIPVARLMEGERDKLLRLDEVLHERVIGQDEAVQLVADAVIRARSGIKDPKRPIGSFIFLGPDRRGQDGAVARAGRVAVRLGGQHGAARHVGIPGAPHGQPADGSAARVRRLRGGRAADRSGPSQALFGRAVRRDREGPPGRVQHAAPDPRRRPAHGCAGPHRGLPEHRDHHDLEHRVRVPARGHRGRRDPRGRSRARDARAPRALPPRVPEQSGRDGAVQAAHARGDRAHRRPADP